MSQFMNAPGPTRDEFNALSDQIVQINSKLVAETLVFDGTKFPAPSVPKGTAQLCVPARNSTNGAIYILWYAGTDNSFRVGAIVSGNAPSTNDHVFVQYVST